MRHMTPTMAAKVKRIDEEVLKLADSDGARPSGCQAAEDQTRDSHERERGSGEDKSKACSNGSTFCSHVNSPPVRSLRMLAHTHTHGKNKKNQPPEGTVGHASDRACPYRRSFVTAELARR